MKIPLMACSVLTMVLCIDVNLARGALITSPAAMPGTTATVDFSQFSDVRSITTRGPVDVGTPIGQSIVFTSTNPDGSLLGSTFYTLGDNGTWGGTLSFAGLDVDAVGNDRYTMTFSFNSSPVSAVGGLLNYTVLPGSGFGDPMIVALSSTGSILESYDLKITAPIATPGATNLGAFRGIVRPSADISAFTLSNSAIVVANLTFTAGPSVPIPEPVSLLLLGSGLAFMAWLGRKRVWPTMVSRRK